MDLVPHVVRAGKSFELLEIRDVFFGVLLRLSGNEGYQLKVVGR